MFFDIVETLRPPWGPPGSLEDYLEVFGLTLEALGVTLEANGLHFCVPWGHIGVILGPLGSIVGPIDAKTHPKENQNAILLTLQKH